MRTLGTIALGLVLLIGGLTSMGMTAATIIAVLGSAAILFAMIYALIDALCPPMSRVAIIALAGTPLAGILAGFTYVLTGMIKARLATFGDVIGGIILFGVFGSVFAAPTTLIGLPAIARWLSPDARWLSLKLTLIGFGLGGFTTLWWVYLFGLLRNMQANPVVGSLLVCAVGAFFGACVGWLMAAYGSEPTTDS